MVMTSLKLPTSAMGDNVSAVGATISDDITKKIHHFIYVIDYIPHEHSLPTRFENLVLNHREFSFEDGLHVIFSETVYISVNQADPQMIEMAPALFGFRKGRINNILRNANKGTLASSIPLEFDFSSFLEVDSDSVHFPTSLMQWSPHFHSHQRNRMRRYW